MPSELTGRRIGLLTPSATSKGGGVSQVVIDLAKTINKGQLRNANNGERDFGSSGGPSSNAMGPCHFNEGRRAG